MFRYIAFLWDRGDPRACETMSQLTARLPHALPGFRVACAEEGVSVYWQAAERASDRAYALPDRSGVVLGTLFPRDVSEEAVPAPVTFDEPGARAIVESRGQRLVNDYWGRYVAFLCGRRADTAVALRDPTGGVPCLMTEHRHVRIFFSALEDCMSLGIQRFSVNWRYVTARLVLQSVQLRETGLSEVRQLLPGEACIVARGAQARTELLWNPVTVANSDPIEDFEMATALARSTALACASAWASHHPRIVHSLSGGLDSSIVLACLRRAPSRPEITCVNYFEQSVWGDERSFARYAVEHQAEGSAPVRSLIECERTAAEVDLRATMTLPPSATPRSCLTLYEHRRLDRPLALTEGASVFTGTFGDGVFCTKKIFSAVDYFSRHGFGRQLPQALYESARAQRIAAWKLLPSVVRAGLQARYRPFRNLEERQAVRSRRFVSSAALEEFARSGESFFTPTWLRTPWRVAPGKAWHLKAMYIPKCELNPLDRTDDPDWVMPLASQPLIELFARIPTYVLTAGGQDRAVARAAFAKDLPTAVLTRRNKAVGNNFMAGLLRRNAALYRETLLEGVLVSEKLLDRSRIEHFLVSFQDAQSRGMAEFVMFHFNLEVWLRNWIRPSGARAADVAA